MCTDVERSPTSHIVTTTMPLLRLQAKRAQRPPQARLTSVGIAIESACTLSNQSVRASNTSLHAAEWSRVVCRHEWSMTSNE